MTAAYDQLRALASDPGRLRWPAQLSRTDVGQEKERKHHPAAVLILFGVRDDAAGAVDNATPLDLDILLLARANTLRHHPGQVSFPGGRLDPGDAGSVAAALREAVEETGLDPAGVEILGELPPAPLAVSGHIVTPVLSWWTRPTPVTAVDQQESAEVFRVPVADLIDPANRCTAVARRRIHTPAFTVQAARKDHLIWGFTAMILDTLLAALGWSVPWDAARIVPVE